MCGTNVLYIQNVDPIRMQIQSPVFKPILSHNALSSMSKNQAKVNRGVKLAPMLKNYNYRVSTSLIESEKQTETQLISKNIP